MTSLIIVSTLKHGVLIYYNRKLAQNTDNVKKMPLMRRFLFCACGIMTAQAVSLLYDKGGCMDYQILSRSPLFGGMFPDEIINMLQCMGAETRNYKKDERILHMGDTVEEIGLVLSGSVLIENNDIWGNRSLLARVGEGHIFAETYACAPGERMMVDVVASQDTQILFLNVKRLLTTCPNSCAYHEKLIRNLLSVSAQKNLHLSRRIFHTSPKTIRGNFCPTCPTRR